MLWLQLVNFIDIKSVFFFFFFLFFFFFFLFFFCFFFVVFFCALIGEKCCSIGSITLNTGSAGFYHFWTEVSVAV